MRVLARSLSYPRLAPLCIVLLGLGACAATPEGELVEAATLVLEGRVFDSPTGEVWEQGAVVVAGDRIVCSGPHGACRWPDGTPVRRFEEATLLPGLIDLHAHPHPHFAVAFLPAGVTTLRGAGNNLGTIARLRSMDGVPRLLASGPRLDGPETVMAHFFEAVGPLGEHPLEEMEGIVVATPEEAAAAVRALHRAGTEWIKLGEKLDAEAFGTAVEEAHALGRRTACDLGLVLTRALTGATLDIVEAARLGVDTIEHHSGLALAYQRRGGDPMDEALDEALLDEIAREVAEHLEAVVPTLLILSQFADPDPGVLEGVPGAEPAERYLGDGWGDLIERSEPVRERARADIRLGRAMLARLREAGLLIGVGTDVAHAPHIVPGGAVQQEMALLVEAGLLPSEALQAASWNAARILGRDDLGHLGAGARADILVVDGDPTRDIRAAGRVAAVWFDGEEVDLEAAWRRLERDLAEWAAR